MLRNKLKQGECSSSVFGRFALIEARGTELNQVWTNIIDNAVDAMNGHGELYLRTRWEAHGWLLKLKITAQASLDRFRGPTVWTHSTQQRHR